MRNSRVFGWCVLATVGVLTIGASVATAQDQKQEKKPAAQGGEQAGGQEMQLPPGWTEQDMQACVEAGTPGAEHEYLAKGAGEWKGEGQMWMAPDTEPMPYECMSNVRMVMDGRYAKCDITSDIPGMGSFHGVGHYGYDNVAQEYVANWIDNHSTGMMTGTGKRSADGKKMEWVYKYNCPITKKPTKMRQVEQQMGEGKMKMEMFTVDPKSGKEYKMLSITFTRVGDAGGDRQAQRNR